MLRLAVIVLCVLTVGVPSADASWTPVPELSGSEVTDLFIDNDTLYAAAIDALYFLPDGSDLWLSTDPVGPGIGISKVVKTGHRIFVGTFQNGVYETTDLGQTWLPRSTGLSGAGSLAITTLAIRGDSLYAGTAGAGVWMLPLNGSTVWQPFRDGLGSLVAWDVYTLHNFNGFLFAGAGQNAHIHRNPPGSPTWSGVEYTPMTGGGEYMIAFGHQGSTLYGCGSNGLFTTTDTGLAWSRFPSPWNGAYGGAVVTTDNHAYAMLAYAAHGTYIFEHDGFTWQQFDLLPTTVAHDMVRLGNRLYVGHFTGLLYLPLDPTDIVDPEHPLPTSPLLHQNFPNPFNPSTAIPYTLPIASEVELVIFDLQGRRVVTLLDGRKSAGNHTVVWDGTGSDGLPVATGIYFYRLRTGDHHLTRKMLLVK